MKTEQLNLNNMNKKSNIDNLLYIHYTQIFKLF